MRNSRQVILLIMLTAHVARGLRSLVILVITKCLRIISNGMILSHERTSAVETTHTGQVTLSDS